MKVTSLALPALCLGGAALLLAPSRPAHGFSKIGGSLGEAQRDFRIFNNFADSTANDNTTEHPMFPGRTGAALALWKGTTEWSSIPHGDGSGDPLNGNVLGSGGANFDPIWAGSASNIGTSNHNVVSTISSCDGGTLAYCETPIENGWRIRFCENRTWDDGPGTVGNRFDIQSVQVHEYGHALGLGHSGVSGATMWPSVGGGSTGNRSINADDIAGLQCIYGVMSVNKPTITALVPDVGAGTMTVHGTNFAATGNEVWFTNAAATPSIEDPLVKVLDVPSAGGGTVITVDIPVGAGKGDLMVNTPGNGGATLSNAYPTDLENTYGNPPNLPAPSLSNVNPSVIDALIPGTDQTITLTGTDLDFVTAVLLDGDAVSPSRWTLVNDTTITLDMPQVANLGVHDLGVTNGAVPSELPVTIAAPATPRLECGTGDAGNAVSRAAGLDLIVAGNPGEVHLVRGGPSPASLSAMQLKLTLVPWQPLIEGGAWVVPASGWQEAHLGALDPALVGTSWFLRSYALVRPRPFPESNLQSIVIVP